MNRKEEQPSQPSIAEMTEKAIEILSKDKDGFLLVVEGGQVDWGGHSHDPQYMVTEFLAFDEAVGKALDFAEKDGNTLLIAFPDHDTGGLSLGNTNKKFNSYKLSVDDMVGTFKNANITFYKLIEMLNMDKDITEKKVIDIFAEHLGLSIDESQAKTILDMRKDFYGIVDYINNNLYAIGWTTYMHSGNDVPLCAYCSKLE
jgi:alkaline phosphatase